MRLLPSRGTSQAISADRAHRADRRAEQRDAETGVVDPQARLDVRDVGGPGREQQPVHEEDGDDGDVGPWRHARLGGRGSRHRADDTARVRPVRHDHGHVRGIRGMGRRPRRRGGAARAQRRRGAAGVAAARPSTHAHHVVPRRAAAGGRRAHGGVPRPARLRPLEHAPDHRRPRAVLQARDGRRHARPDAPPGARTVRRGRPRPRQLRRPAAGPRPP